MKVTKDQALALYRMLQTIRQSEEGLARQYAAGFIHGACHTYVGEEAIATGVCAHLTHDDAVFSTHRGHGHALAKGVSPRELFAELYGRETGVSHGRGGSMHLFKPEVGMMGTSGIVAPCILQATGAGYSFKLRGVPHVGAAFFGDGASNNGAFHEGLNLAAIYQLPVVFVCENNQFATEIAFSYATRNTDVWKKAENYGMPGVCVDGNDVLAIHAEDGEAVERARAGGGPTLIEAKTYRTRPHSEGMRDGGYRSLEEIEAWKKRDPIKILTQKLMIENIVPQSELDAIAEEIRLVVEDAAEFAKNSPYPDGATALQHVYAEA
jgi:2-oxoisovalerate dehydrogenase E1 component